MLLPAWLFVPARMAKIKLVQKKAPAQIAVAPAPAMTSTVEIGPSCVTVPNAVPEPDKSAAPISQGATGAIAKGR